MKNSRCCCFIIIAALLLLFFTGCIEQPKIAVTYVQESAPQISGKAQPSSTPSSEVSAKTELPPDMTVEEELTVDLNNDGIMETIIIGSCESESIGYEDFITLYVSGDSGLYKADITDGSYRSAFTTKTDQGDLCLFISIALIDDNSYLFSFNGIEPILRNEVCGLVKASETEITVEDDTDVFGSWYYTRDYTLTNDFMLEPISDYRIITDDMEPLHTINKLPVEMLVNGVYTKQFLDEDSYIYPVSKDDNGHLNFRLKNGSEGRITYTFEDYKFYIDGIHEDEYFDNIVYWG